MYLTIVKAVNSLPQWTDRQAQAISARDCNLLVAAAAGSGKTAVLVERICALAREGMRVDRMLVVTFTRAAAAEMRQKILEAFQRIADSDEPDAGLFAEQAALVERAQISTLHGFCGALLRTHFQSVGVDPTFRVGDDKETGPLREEALRTLIVEEYAAGNPDFDALAACWTDEQIGRQVEQLYSFVRSQPAPWAWLSAACDAYTADEAALEDSPWVRALLTGARAEIRSAQVNFQQALQLCSLPGGCGPYCDTLERDIAAMEGLLTLCDQGYTALRDALSVHAFPTIARASKDCDPDMRDQAKKLRDAGKDRIKRKLAERLLADPLALHAEDLRAELPQLRALAALTQSLDEAFAKRKLEKNLLDYGDLEHKALEAVRQATVSDAVRAQYDAIFVDEYQDSSVIQEELVQRIARESNVFMVGDVKQSIYRFRQAEPKLFLNKLDTFSPAENAVDRRVDLNKNFRSRPNVLAAVNLIFSYAMRREETEIPYDAEARLYPGLTPADEDPAVELHVVAESVGDTPTEDANAIEENDVDADVPQGDGEDSYWNQSPPSSRIAKEATLAAQRIHALVGTTYWDSKKNTYRPLRYRDVVILLRVAKGIAQQVQQVFEQHGIPVYSDAGEAFFMMPEVRSVIDLLRVLDNPLHEHALLSAMRGPAGGFSNDALASIRGACTDGKAGYYDALLACAAGEGALAQRVQRFLALLDDLRLYAQAQPLEDLIWRMYTLTGCYAHAGALPGGRARQANLRMLAERAASFAQHGGGLSAFLWEAEQLRARGDSDSAKALGESEDVVRIMTMHMSKGLEFPVVICLDLGRSFGLKGGPPPMLDCHSTMGLAMQRIDPDMRTRYATLACEAVRLQRKRETLADATRLLYVAMTRAQHQLILVGHGGRDAEGLDSKLLRWANARHGELLSEADNMMDLLLAPLRIHRDGGVLRAEGSCTGEEELEDTSRWSVRRYNHVDTLATAQATATTWLPMLQEQAHTHTPDAALVSALTWTPHSPPAEDGKLKTTVSAMLRELQGETVYEMPRPWPQFLSEQPTVTLDGAARGTAFHAAMRALDFAMLATSPDDALLQAIDGQLLALEEAQRLSPGQRQAVSTTEIAAFVRSPIGQRMLASATVRREWAFNLRMHRNTGVQLVQGVVDCCFMESAQNVQGWVLMDYKTDGDPDPQAVLARYAPQVALYTQALIRITGYPVHTAGLYLTKKGSFFPYDAIGDFAAFGE